MTYKRDFNGTHLTFEKVLELYDINPQSRLAISLGFILPKNNAVEVPHGLEHIDIYVICRLFSITEPELSNALKKMLCAGQSGGKSKIEDFELALECLYEAIQNREIGLPIRTNASLLASAYHLGRLIDELIMINNGEVK